jgi:tryptophanyl-tRNA synthetase
LEEPKNPDTDVTFKLYSLIADEAETETLRQNYLNGGFGYGHAKQALYELILKRFQKERELYNYYIENNEALEKKLREGEEKAEEIARRTIQEVRAALGFN